ncbi:uncharacterized protein LOC121589407 [Anopheles merus]|uniref:uncharacterized protein LOC121589407 n=1 Tax=Anopheles merus TaxID=30066 RepID=UPI001BE3D453|nr:uncharacterized protein LOC121589407 [Anopheles merus]
MGRLKGRARQSKEELGKKACIREHKRLMKMNVYYDHLRQLLHIPANTSKVLTLAHTAMYIDVLEFVLNTGVNAKRNDATEETAEKSSAEPAMDCNGETAFLLRDGFRAILPADDQQMPLTELLHKYPYIQKLLVGVPSVPPEPANQLDDDDCNVYDQIFPSLVEVQVAGLKAECEEQPVTDEKVNEQIFTDPTPATSNLGEKNSEQFLIKHSAQMQSLRLAPWKASNNHELECLLMSENEQDLGLVLPTFPSLVSSIPARREGETSCPNVAPPVLQLNEDTLTLEPHESEWDLPEDVSEFLLEQWNLDMERSLELAMDY